MPYVCVTHGGFTALASGRGAGGVPHSQLPQIRARGAATRPLCSAVLAYMQLLEDYSEPQPSMFYQTPQNEHIYQQKNKHLMEVYGFNDSFSSADAPQDLAPPPALPPKQRQLVSGPRILRTAEPGGSQGLGPLSPLGRTPSWRRTHHIPRGRFHFPDELTRSLPPAPPSPRPGGGGAFLSQASPMQLGRACAQNVCFLC